MVVFSYASAYSNVLCCLLHWLNIIFHNVTRSPLIIYQAKVAIPCKQRKLIIFRDTGNHFRGRTCLLAQTDEFFTFCIPHSDGLRFKQFIHRIGIGIIKMPPFLAIPSKATLLHDILQELSIGSRFCGTVGIIPICFLCKIVEFGGHFQHIPMLIHQCHVHCTSPAMISISCNRMRYISRIRTDFP